jgi:hypothetical protein
VDRFSVYVAGNHSIVTVEVRIDILHMWQVNTEYSYCGGVDRYSVYVAG